MNDNDSTSSRKLDHVRIVMDEDVAAKGVYTGFAAYRMPHDAVPELDLAEIDTSTTLLGKPMRAPLLISSMTGGAVDVARINLALAEAAQALGLAMGVGSQRSAIRDERLAYTYQVRKVAPHIPLLANLGAVQLNYGYGVDECRRAVEMIEADALILHFNVLQEAVQPEGNTNFKGLLRKIELVCRDVGVPVIAKEVGNGIGAPAARRLIEAGVWGIDVAGAGGTSWSEVERFRQGSARGARVAGAFADWGIPTTEAIRAGARSLPRDHADRQRRHPQRRGCGQGDRAGGRHRRHRQAGAHPGQRGSRRAGGNRGAASLYRRAADRHVLQRVRGFAGVEAIETRTSIRSI